MRSDAGSRDDGEAVHREMGGEMEQVTGRNKVDIRER